MGSTDFDTLLATVDNLFLVDQGKLGTQLVSQLSSRGTILFRNVELYCEIALNFIFDMSMIIN